MKEPNANQAKTCFSKAFVIFLMPFLFFVLMLFGYLGIVPLDIKSHTVLIVFIIFVTYLLFVKHNAHYMVCRMFQELPRMQETLNQAMRDNALTIVGQTKSTLDVRNFIQEYYKGLRSDQFASVASSVFPMMGILGTFTAIALSMPDFSVSDVEALDKDISMLLGGIGTAFYASIYGIFLSLVWTYFEKKGSLKIDNIIFSLEKTHQFNVWKESELIKNQHLQSKLKDEAIVATLKKSFSTKFVIDLNAQYLNNFSSIAELTNKSFTDLTNDIRKSSIVLSNALEKVETREERKDEKEIGDIEKGLIVLEQNTRHFHQQLHHFDAEVDHNIKNINTKLETKIEKLNHFAIIINQQNLRLIEEIKALKK